MQADVQIARQAGEAARRGEIGVGRPRIPGRMVMGEDKPGRTKRKAAFKERARRKLDPVGVAFADQVDSIRTLILVKENDEQYLILAGPDPFERRTCQMRGGR